MKQKTKRGISLLMVLVMLMGITPATQAAMATADYELDFSTAEGLVEESTTASITDGALVFNSEQGSYATLEAESLAAITGNTVAISIDAKVPAALGRGEEYTLLTIGKAAADDKKAETALYIRAGRKNIFAGIVNGENTRKEVSGSALAANTETNIMLTYSYDETEKGTLSVFVDGILAQRATEIDIPLQDVVSGAAFTLGQKMTGSVTGGFYNGALDNLKIWSSVPTAADIAELNGIDLSDYMAEKLQADLAYLKLDSDTTSAPLYYDQRVHDPVIHDVLLWSESKIGKYPITWESSNEELLKIIQTKDGVDYSAKIVKTPDTDTKVTLTATITAPDPDGGAPFTQTKDLVVTVTSLATRRQMDFDALEITSMDDVRDNVPLIVNGKNGSKITWTSSNPEVITDTGVVKDANGNDIYCGGLVTRPAAGEAPVPVTLTATVTYDGVEGSLQKTFDVKVTPESVKEEKVLDHYLFIYYAENNDWNKDGVTKEEIYMGVSKDGIYWNDLNVQTRGDGTKYTQPLLMSTVGDMGTRDPHIVRSPDGDKFYVMATDLHSVGTALDGTGGLPAMEGAKGNYGMTGNNFDCISGNRTLVIWETTDLTDWGDARLVRCNFDNAGNTYAPEAVWDAARDAYLVYWSSNNNDCMNPETGEIEDELKGGIYYCYTRDFITFSEPQLWFNYSDVPTADPNATGKFSVYDTHIAYDSESKLYYRFSTTSRLFVQTSKDLMGPWSTAIRLPQSADVDINAGNIEAPTTYQLPDGDWMLLGDNYSVYDPYQAKDLSGFATGAYEKVELNYPTNRAESGDTFPRYKHGTIINISEDEYNELIKAYGIDEKVDPEPQPEPDYTTPSVSKPTVKITGEGAAVFSNNNRELQITPDNGWKIENVEVNGVSMGAVDKLTGLKSGDVVKIIFVKSGQGSADPSKFVDIQSHWAKDTITAAVNKGLFEGTSETTFEPDTLMTRAMIVTVLHRIAGSPKMSGTSAFSDVPNGKWYTEAVIWAEENGIVNGYGNGIFAPDENVTREQLAVIVSNYAKFMKYDLSGTADLSKFVDAAAISTWANTPLGWAVANSLISGKPGQVLDPSGNATRAECVVILVRFIDKFSS